ncbi:MAG TPA: putative toxin-antitoxin system toxin component, PIN family [Bacteroidetes bacterium]|nr:putative toxin-antitoxin system toxin component, PIN family [Bacteroidota bacterium]
MNIVLDTNCLIQILPQQAEHRWVYDAILQGNIILFVSTEIILEYEEVINEFYGSDVLGGNVANLLLQLPKTQKRDIYFNWNLIGKDPDDNKYVDLAVATNAELIVTNDGHFKVLKDVDFPKVIFMNLEDFKEYWEERFL